MAREQAATFGRRTLRLGGIVLLGVGVVALGLVGWQWRANATVGHIAVRGTQHAPPDTVRRLAGVDSGAVMGDVDPALVADRVERHPWIERAEVTNRWMRRTLAIAVAERSPAALAIDTRGRPAYYLARTGHAMSIPDSTGYDAPLVRGLHGEYHPVRRLAPPLLRDVLTALPETGTTDLVAEIEMRPDSTVRIVTAPVGEHGAIPVHLGADNVSKKLRALRAFARHVLAAKPNAPIEQIDLRFDGQIVARKHPPG